MYNWIKITQQDKGFLSSSLLKAIQTKVKCDHPESAIIFYNREFRRAVKFKCEKCMKQIFIKCFGNDNNVPESEKKIRYEIERKNIIYFSDKPFCSDSFRPPTYIDSIDSPYYSIIEDYIEYEPFLSSLTSAIFNYNNKTKLFDNLALLARHMAEFHNETPSDEDVKELKKLKHKHDSDGILRKMHESASNIYLYERLFSYNEIWKESNNFQSAIKYKNHVHGDLSTVNLLFSGDGQIRVLDFETLHINTPFVDIGTITAELKLAFHVYGADNYPFSESCISFFLQEYYRHSNMHLSYRQFTFAQAFYMGQQLLNTSVGDHFNEVIRRWCAEITCDIWKLIETESDYFTPPFVGKKGVCFDFYNTLVRIVDDESQKENFEMVRDYLIEKLGCREHSVPNAIQIRDMYFHEIDVVNHRNMSTCEHPDVDLVSIWRSVLTKEIVPPDTFSTPDGEKKLIELLLVFRASAIKIFEPIEDAVETLRILKERDITVGILSDAQPAYFEREFLKSGIINIADFHVLSTDHGIRKPSEDLFNEVLKHLELSPDEIVFVGDDMFRDIFGAKRIGMSSVYIPSEHGISYYEDCKPDEVIRSIGDLLLLFGIEKE